MFRDCKSGGDNLEGTKANSQRLTSLILLIAIAYTASCLKGLKIRKTGQQEYINRLKDKKTKYSRHSYFLTGLYSQLSAWLWVEWLDSLNKY